MNIIDERLKFGNMNMSNDPKMLIVHHLEAEGAQWTIQMIHNMHITERGWAGIGYHYYIRKDGSIYKGRPDNAIGAHCQGCNTNTLGIAFEGNYDENTPMPDVQFNAWCELKAYLGNLPVFGHKEKGSSECPGKYFPLEKVRNASLKTGTWKKSEDGTKWWYSYSDGTYPTTWAKIDGKWYLFDGNGYMLTGWEQKDGNWYYFWSSGEMVTGWVNLNGSFYYLSESGAMKTGWIQDKDKWYYLYSNGQMASNTNIGEYKLNEKGQWVE